MAMVEAHNLTRKFGNFIAVDGVSLEIDRGEVLGFLGPNGAGKTTTIRMLAGIIAPTSGWAVIDSRRTDGSVEKLHEVIGLLTETPGFYNRLSAQRNLEYYAGFYEGLKTEVQIEKYLKIMGLWGRRDDRVGTFSKGMKQRLALARALLHEPGVLFLDEPTSGLDPEAAEEVRELIRKMSREGRTIFLSTHNLAEAELLCQRIAVVRTRLLALDAPQNLRQKLFRRKSIIRLELINDSLIQVLKASAPAKSWQVEENRVIVEMADTEKELPELVRKLVQAGGSVLEVTEEKHSLQDIYLSLIREGEKL